MALQKDKAKKKPESSFQDRSTVIKRFKKILKISNDKELAEILEVQLSSLAVWKKENSLDYAHLIELCALHNIDLNHLFFGTPSSHPKNDQSSPTPLIDKHTLYEYTMGVFKNSLSDLPSYTFPFVKNEKSRAFQTASKNMWPVIEENSLVICEEVQLHEIKEKEVFVFISRKKGFFLNRVKKIGEKSLLLTNDHPHYRENNPQLKKDHIDEVWSVRGILSTNIQGETEYERDSLQNGRANGRTHENIKTILVKKERELVTSSLKMMHLKSEIESILKDVDGKMSHGVKPKLKALLGKESIWKYFMKKFVDVHPGFIEELQKRHHNLSKGDIDFCSLIHLGLSNKEIGVLLNISHNSVITKKYRLRKKMNFSEQENSLEEYLKRIILIFHQPL